MKTIFAAAALALAIPSLAAAQAQQAPQHSGQHQGHGQHQQGQHDGHEGHAGHKGCCPEGEKGAMKPCCEKAMREGQKMPCCAKADAKKAGDAAHQGHSGHH